MSEWHSVTEGDIEIDDSTKEVNVLVCDNDFGNVYATITWEVWIQISKKIEALAAVGLL